MTENYVCYFCDTQYPHPSCFIDNYNGIWMCQHCEMLIPINNTQENDDCCVCFEYKPLINLPTCIHKVCLDCCKTIYFGSTTNNPPIQLMYANITHPNWPYDINEDDDNDHEYIRQQEYDKFETTYFDITTKSYGELIIIRNNLISERPEWMNTDEFIIYENCLFRYRTEFEKLDKEWEEYNANKTKGNGTCPLCRIKPI